MGENENIQSQQPGSVIRRSAKLVATVAVAAGLALTGISGASAADTTQAVQSQDVAASPAGTVTPQVAMVWTVWQDNFYSKDSCIQMSFWVLQTHTFIRDYQCLQNPYGSINPGRWSLWVYHADGIYPIN